jgi:hypothetical protein
LKYSTTGHNFIGHYFALHFYIAKKISNKYLILMKLEYMNKANLQFY